VLFESIPRPGRRIWGYQHSGGKDTLDSEWPQSESRYDLPTYYTHGPGGSVLFEPLPRPGRRIWGYQHTGRQEPLEFLCAE